MDNDNRKHGESLENSAEEVVIKTSKQEDNAVPLIKQSNISEETVSASRPSVKKRTVVKAETQKKKNSAFSRLVSDIRRSMDKLFRANGYFEIKRKFAIIGFSVISLLALFVCVEFGYSYNGDSIRLVSQMSEAERSSAKAYRIVYSEADPWGLDASNSLNSLFFEKTGASLKIVPDTESVSRHEIRVGYTNRASDDYLTSVSTLGTDGYAIVISSGDNINIVAFSEAGINAAIKYFMNSYVGAYRGGELTFANRSNFSFISRSGEEPDISLRQSKITLNFSTNGKFRILVLSDPDANLMTVEAIETIVKEEKPDLVMFAGDASSGLTSKAELEAYLKVLSAPLEESKTPWAVVFGEQDTEGGLSVEAQMEVYSSFKYCVAKSDYVKDGTVSYFLPLYSAGEGDSSSSPIFGVWAMGQVPMISKTNTGAAFDDLISDYRENGTDYGYVTTSQIAWFSENAKILDRESGGYLPTVMITHTPIHEFSVICENPDLTGFAGEKGENISSSPVNSGLFAALLEARNVLGLYVGHDHLNSFSGKYCGIELGYCASIGYDGYGFGGTFETNNRLRGGRIIELSERNGEIALSSRFVCTTDYETEEN